METASNEPLICPFLRAIHDDVSMSDPIERPDQANRCTALGDAAPQSLRQQEVACLARAHVTCPRFVRGALLLVEPSQRGGGRQLTPAIVGALLVLAASFALSVGFVVANGGMNLPVAASGSPEAAVGSASPGASQSPAQSSDASGPVMGFGLIGADHVPVLMLGSDPASAYTGYEAFGRPAIAALMGTDHERAATQVRLDAPVSGDRGVCEYVPAQVMSTPDGLHALPLTDRPGSLGPVAHCDGFLVLGEGSASAQAGDLIDYVAFADR